MAEGAVAKKDGKKKKEGLEAASVLQPRKLSDAEAYAISMVVADVLGCHPHWLASWREVYLKATLERYDLSKSMPTMNALMKRDVQLDLTDLLPLLQENRDAVLREFLTMNLAAGAYDARARTMLYQLASRLNMSRVSIARMEMDIAHQLNEYKLEHKEEIDAEIKRLQRERRNSQWMKVGAAGVIGGVAIGLTGGLAAPLVAAGVGAVFGTAATVALGSAAGLIAIGTLFGVAGAGLTGYKMRKRVGDLSEFYFVRLIKEEPLSVTVCVTGWVDSAVDPVQDFVDPWRELDANSDIHCLVFEPKALYNLSSVLRRMLKDRAVGFAISEVLKRSIFATLLSAVAWPAAILQLASVLDNSWSVALNKADKAGLELANALLSRAQGGRPVNLVGYSIGARVIFSCLKELSTRKQADGLVQDVVLLGPPVTGSSAQWQEIRRMVSGRLVIGFSARDWLLRFLFRGSSANMAVAGLGGVRDVAGVENVDLGNIVGSSHRNYKEHLTACLLCTGMRTASYGKPRRGSVGQRVHVRGKGFGILRYLGPIPELYPPSPETVADAKLALVEAASAASEEGGGDSSEQDGAAATAAAAPAVLHATKPAAVRKSQGIFASTLGRFGRKPAKAQPTVEEQAEAVANDNAPVVCGVSLDDAAGDSDGSLPSGTRLFTTRNGHGAFVPLAAHDVCIMELGTPQTVNRFQCYSPQCQRLYGRITCYSASCPSRDAQFQALNLLHFASETEVRQQLPTDDEND